MTCTWTTKSWLGLQKQRISVVLHTAIAEQIVNELACGEGAVECTELSASPWCTCVSASARQSRANVARCILFLVVRARIRKFFFSIFRRSRETRETHTPRAPTRARASRELRAS